MHLINDALSLGKQVLYLVPEIALTTQLTQRLRRVFGERLLIYHSKFSDNERVDIWKKLLTSSEPCVIIGVRSSVFLPYSNLGLVIIDEEHDTSYKQQDPAPRYNGRDTAIMLAHMHGAKTVLGSATPAIDTYYKALNGRYGLVELTTRYEDIEMPQVHTIDLKKAWKKHEMNGMFSQELVGECRKALENNEQVILFQNRRGYAPMVRCKQCAWVPTCVNCDVSLTYHRRVETLTCHYCGHTITLPTVCPACGSPSIEIVGYGTERIEEEIDIVFPNEKISRMDLDTTRSKNSYDRIIDEFSQHKTNILVGTQMVTKGLDFDAVSIVGILNADTMIHFPDFRSHERAFNMLEQVAGRAGRKNKQGDADYGDLGEQTLTGATLLSGAIAENATFSNVSIQGATELHNVSGTVTVADAGTLVLNAVDCWLTLSGTVVAASVSLSRGSLARNDSTSTLQVLTRCFLDNVTLTIPTTTLGATTDLRGCDVNAVVTATDIAFSNCQVRADIDQRDVSGVISVKCVGNMFHDGAQHYVHATTADSVVNGIWANNGSSYDDRHWIRLDRTNLMFQDNDHRYTYSGNSEPYLMKYSGRNHPMRFPVYRANRDARDLYTTTTLPFVCINDNTYEVYCVPRHVSWKCFTVGRGYLARSGQLRATWKFGIQEGSYTEHTMGNITMVLNWGALSTSVAVILDGDNIGYAMMVSRDADGVASYDVSFEAEDADHNPATSPGGNYSNGTEIGVLTRAPYDGWSSIVYYPYTPGTYISLFVHMDPDFQAGTTTPVS